MRRHSSSLTSCGALARRAVPIVALAVSACGGGETSRPRMATAPPQLPPQGPQAALQAPAPAGGNPSAFAARSQFSGPTGAPPGRMAPLGPVTADPLTIQNILSGALAGGSALLGALPGREHAAVEQGIRRQVDSSARGMRPDGPLLSARLAGESHAESSLSLEPGACYTIIGFGGAGVFDYQIHVMTAPPMPPQILAQSTPGGVSPVVGPNEQCLQNPLPMPLLVKVDLHVVRGQGLVGAQVYRR